MIFFFALKVSIMHLQWEFDDESIEFLLTNLNVMLKVIEYQKGIFAYMSWIFWVSNTQMK